MRLRQWMVFLRLRPIFSIARKTFFCFVFFSSLCMSVNGKEHRTRQTSCPWSRTYVLEWQQHNIYFYIDWSVADSDCLRSRGKKNKRDTGVEGTSLRYWSRRLEDNWPHFVHWKGTQEAAFAAFFKNVGMMASRLPLAFSPLMGLIYVVKNSDDERLLGC